MAGNEAPPNSRAHCRRREEHSIKIQNAAVTHSEHAASHPGNADLPEDHAVALQRVELPACVRELALQKRVQVRPRACALQLALRTADEALRLLQRAQRTFTDNRHRKQGHARLLTDNSHGERGAADKSGGNLQVHRQPLVCAVLQRDARKAALGVKLEERVGERVEHRGVAALLALLLGLRPLYNKKSSTSLIFVTHRVSKGYGSP